MTSLPRRYSGYDVLAKWDTPSWDDATRAVVAARLGPPPPRRFFDAREWETLVALCDTVIPQPDRADPVPIAPWIDAAVHEGRSAGTRYSVLPPFREAWRRGLAALDAEADARSRRRFHDLAPSGREALLKAVDEEDVRAAEWSDLPPRKLLREALMSEIARVYYSHPAAWSEIGFGGPASPRGYVRLGPNRRDPWEAEEAPATRRPSAP